jgi:hypothetical protein
MARGQCAAAVHGTDDREHEDEGADELGKRIAQKTAHEVLSSEDRGDRHP